MNKIPKDFSFDSYITNKKLDTNKVYIFVGIKSTNKFKVYSKNLPTLTNKPSATCQHEWKAVGSGFLLQQYKCTKCGEITDDYGFMH